MTPYERTCLEAILNIAENTDRMARTHKRPIVPVMASIGKIKELAADVLGPPEQRDTPTVVQALHKCMLVLSGETMGKQPLEDALTAAVQALAIKGYGTLETRKKAQREVSDVQ